MGSSKGRDTGFFKSESGTLITFFMAAFSYVQGDFATEHSVCI